MNVFCLMTYNMYFLLLIYLFSYTILLLLFCDISVGLCNAQDNSTMSLLASDWCDAVRQEFTISGIPTPIRPPDCSNQSVFFVDMSCHIASQYASPIYENYLLQIFIYLPILFFRETPRKPL